MDSENPPTTPNTNFTETQSETLGALRTRYQQDGDLFTGPELSRLRFMRWLRENRPVNEGSTGRQYSLMIRETPTEPAARDSEGTPCGAL